MVSLYLEIGKTCMARMIVRIRLLIKLAFKVCGALHGIIKELENEVIRFRPQQLSILFRRVRVATMRIACYCE